MKKWFYIFIVIVGLGIMGCGHWPWDRGEGPNVLVNPNFDESPWDTGWTWDTTGSATGIASWSACVVRDSGYSLPNCCKISVVASVGGPSHEDGSASVEAMIYQMFNPIDGVEFKAHIKGSTVPIHPVTPEIQFCVNGQWESVFSISLSIFEGDWAEISGKIDGNISGIKVYVKSEVSTDCSGKISGVDLYIDNIYVRRGS